MAFRQWLINAWNSLLLGLIRRLQRGRQEDSETGFQRLGVEKQGPDWLTSLPSLVTLNFFVYCAIAYLIYLSLF